MRPLKTSSLRFAALALAAWVAAMDATSAQDNTRTYQIAEQSLGQALREFALANNLDLLFSPDLVAGRKSSRLEGKFSVDEGLRTLLRGSGLEFSLEGSRVVISESKEVPARQATSSAPAPRSTNGYTQLAQAESAHSQSGSSTTLTTNVDNSSQQRFELDEIVVTGTHLRGVATPSPVVTLDSRYIAESGRATVADVLATMPQNFSGGQNVGVVGTNRNNQDLTGASSPNLRGLGSGSTLTLVNGRRLAFDGYQGGPDISVVPLAAVERIEVLLDGASAVYGSDAVAGVINVKLRNDFDGAETRAYIGQTTHGDGTQQQYSQTLGHTWSGGNIVGSIEYNHTDAVDARDRDFTRGLGTAGYSLLPDQDRKSLFVAGRQSLNDSVALFADGLYTQRDMDRFNSVPPVFANHDRYEMRQYYATVGAEMRIGSNWTLTAYGTDSNDHAETIAFASFPVGAPPTAFPAVTYANQIRLAEVQASGDLMRLSSGTMSLALGAGYRDTEFEYLTVGFPANDVRGQRSSHYVYAELAVPLVGADDSRAGLTRLELTAAARYEDFEVFGDSTDPKLGLIYAPLADVTMQVSWGTSFRTPELYKQFGSNIVNLRPLVVPINGKRTVLSLSGGNAELTPEEAETWTVKLSYDPAAVAGLHLAATGFYLDYTDQIGQPFIGYLTAVNNPAIYAPFITYDPDPTMQQALIASGTFNNLSGSPYDPAQVAMIVNGKPQNISSAKARGIDFDVEYGWQFGSVELRAFANVSRLRLDERIVATLPELRRDGGIFYPPSTRARAGFSLHRGPIGAVAAVSYTEGSRNTVSTTQSQLASWTTVDMQLSYAPQSEGLLAGMRFALSVQNLLDRDPPFLAYGSSDPAMIGFDSTNASPLGRFLSLQVSKTW